MSTELLDSPLMASLLESDFPQEVFVIALDRRPQLHMCLRAENVPGYEVVHGLACAKTRGEASALMAGHGFPGVPTMITFEEARELSKTKPEPVCGLFLGDAEGNCIAFHFTR